MYLLDTHVFLWLNLRSNRVPKKLRNEIEDPDVRVFVSAVTAWEIAIKHAIGKLEVPGDPSVFVPRRIRSGKFSDLPILTDHALTAGKLPLHHVDPFDRMLVAQAQYEGLSLITADKALAKYDVRVVTI